MLLTALTQRRGLPTPKEASRRSFEGSICKTCFSTYTAKLVLIRPEVKPLFREPAGIWILSWGYPDLSTFYLSIMDQD